MDAKKKENKAKPDRGKNVKRGKRNYERQKWNPLTTLGRMVDDKVITSINDVFKRSLPIRETEIVDKLIGEKDEYVEQIMKKVNVKKQTTAGQKVRSKVWVLIGDCDGNIGLGVKAHKEKPQAIQGATNMAKLSLIPVRRGYWGNKIGVPHTVPMKVSGKQGSVTVRLVPAPRGTGIVGAATMKTILKTAGVKDCYTQSTGQTRTTGNFIYATFKALNRTYTYLTPEFWGRPNLFELLPQGEKKGDVEGDEESVVRSEEDDEDDPENF